VRYANYMADPESSEPSLASRLRLAVVRLNRRLRAQRTNSSVTLTQVSALSALRKCGPLTPGEVRDRLAGAGAGQRELAYSTVVTTMSRLHAKGLLSRRRAGRGFCYAPVDEASLAAGRMSSALGSGSDRDAVLSRFVSGLSGRDAELLRRLLGGAPDGS